MKDVGFTEDNEENRDHVTTCGNIGLGFTRFQRQTQRQQACRLR